MAKDPGKTLRTARLFPVSATNRTFRERLSATDKIDFWKVNILARSTLNLTLGGIMKGANVNMALLNSNPRLLGGNKKPGNQVETFSRIVEPGTYYVKVNVAQLPKNRRANTSYALTLSAVPTDDQLGNSFETATPLQAATGTYNDFVGNTDPNDFLGFRTLIAGQFNVSLTGLNDDANLELYDGSRNLLFASNNPGTAEENINQRLAGISGSSYFLRVTPASGKNASYSLNYAFTPETPVRTGSGLQYIDINPGTGATPRTGQRVTVQYTGLLTNGVKFDSSRDRNQPFSFQIGVGDVIRGWDEGISTMAVGARRQLIIPAELAYGSRGSGSTIPPNATLIFDVEVISIG